MVNYIASIAVAALALTATTATASTIPMQDHLKQYAPAITRFTVNKGKFHIWLDGDEWAPMTDGTNRCSHKAVAVVVGGKIPNDGKGHQLFDDVVICDVSDLYRESRPFHGLTHKSWKSFPIEQVHCDIVLSATNPLRLEE
ncbi:hypothetical protein BDF22DRAFT_678035 [Syncephalis plumigaleata]|nr:hypothetical protein BDF22DRAFT_678035 [Syncephalis plumigaleata]